MESSRWSGKVRPGSRRSDKIGPPLNEPYVDPMEKTHTTDSVSFFETKGHPYIDFVQLEHPDAIWDDDAADYDEGQMRATAVVKLNLRDQDLGSDYNSLDDEAKDDWLDERHLDIERYFDTHHGARNLDKTSLDTGPRDFGEWDERAIEFTTPVPTGSTGADIVRALERETQASEAQGFDPQKFRAFLDE